MRSTLAIAVSLASVSLVVSSGCAPRTAGLEARKEADARFQRTTSLVSFDQAKQAFESGELDKARKEVEKALARSNREAKYWSLLGRIELESKRLERALEAFAKAIECDPALAEPYYYRGIVYQRWSQNDKSIADYLKASELDPERISYVLAAAEVMIAERQLDDARMLLLPKLAYFEHNAAMHELLGDIAILSDDPVSAATSYERALVIDPDAPLLGDKLVAALFDAGEFQKCLDAARRQRARAASAQTTGKRFVPTLETMRHEGRSLAMLGRTAESRIVFSDTVREYPEDVDAWRDLATAALALGDLPRAQSASERLVALAADDAGGYMLRGMVADQKGTYDEAVRWHRLACERAPRNAEMKVALALALSHMGKKDEGLAVLKEALALEPQSELAQRAMAAVNEQ
jgi:tetratricopeptide (TPR) repeat protein